ncbi:peptidoglycan-binding domain-containing protein [Streptomyces sp. DT224]|uniref:peptidoglycan-binding domain-containing protein n=1 Tax=Streptomyces sp. DT224 TaxID=3393426 RepID=UPI003CFB2EFD
MSRSWIRTIRSAGLVAAMAAGLLGGVAATPSVAASHECDRQEPITKNGTYVFYVPFQYEPIHQSGCLVHKGAVGGEVKAIQRSLTRCYGRDIVVDGVFGDKTFAALKRVQAQIGVTADGVYGPKTRDAMVWPRFRVSTGQFVNCVSW